MNYTLLRGSLHVVMDMGKNAVAVWLAVIGLIASAVGYVFAYFKELDVQSNAQNHELVIKLISQDSFESSKNLIWASEAKLIKLPDETIKKLKENPGSGPSGGVATLLPQAADTIEDLSSETASLVQSLGSLSKSTRQRSLDRLLQFSREANVAQLNSAVRAAVVAITGSNLDALSAAGRINVLYFLERVDWSKIGSAEKTSVTKALDNIVARKQDGIQIGDQTLTAIRNIHLKLKP